jgi:type VI secretion system VasD/TssJ family lipoprotein
MRKRWIQAAALGVCLLTAACSQKLSKPDWKFQKEAIRIHIKADHDLNLYNKKTHTLYMCFYQLSELNAFDQLAQDDSGIRRLLEAKMFDPSVAAVSNKTILSGEHITLSLDRAERAQYLAVVAGYYAHLSDNRMVRRHKIQVLKKRKSFFKKTYQCIPCPLDIELLLGPNQIESSKVITTNEKCRDECE